MSRVVALLALPLPVQQLADVIDALARAYPGAVLGRSTDYQVIVVEDPSGEAGGPLDERRTA